VLSEDVQGVLIDIAGVLYDGDTPIPGAVEAILRLTEAGVPHRFLTNTTRSTRQRLLEKLRRMGFGIEWDSLFTAPVATLVVIDFVQFDHRMPEQVVFAKTITPQIEVLQSEIDAHDTRPIVVLQFLLEGLGELSVCRYRFQTS